MATKFDRRETIAGLVLTLVGLGAALHALSAYEFGALRRMGPGFFPAVIGLALAAIGLAMAAKGVRSAPPDALPPLAARPLVCTTLSIALFALLIEPAGLLIAAAALTLVVSIGDGRFSLKRAAALSAALTFICWLVFAVALALPVKTLP